MGRLTALAKFHEKHGGRMVDFAGWNLPVQYTGIMEEHMAVRNSAGLFDVSHMGEFLVRGKDALPFLNYALTNSYTTLKDNCARYGILCSDEGAALDDLFVYRLNAETFLIICNAVNTGRDFERLKFVKAQKNFEVSVENQSDTWSLLALQGPDTNAVLERVFARSFDDLKRFEFLNLENLYISRTGYTGSDGVEILLKNSDAEALAEKILSCGAKPCGLGARDSLRLEAQYPLYGHELSENINPLEAGLGWAVKFDKDFAGREKLLEKKNAGLERQVAFFVVRDRRMLRPGAEIFCGKEKIADVLSGAWSPVLNAPIGSCLAKKCNFSKELFAKVRENLIKVEFKNKFL